VRGLDFGGKYEETWDREGVGFWVENMKKPEKVSYYYLSSPPPFKTFSTLESQWVFF